MLYWIWLTTRKGIGNRTIQKILSYFETAQDVFHAGEAEYRRAGLTPKEIEALLDKSLEEPRQILRSCARKEIHILTLQDVAYPQRLRNIEDPPAVLYYTGVLPALDDEPVIAIVGSRHCSPYAMACAKRLGYQIAMSGGIVVSGMAHGADAMAMTGAIPTGRMVIGVLGCGLDIVYPAKNRQIYNDLRAHGCLISEYPPGTPPRGSNFPVRNRIISGLSCGVVIVEAPAKSGALITAQHALDQGRDVFVVPGNAGVTTCAGSNRLLKEGAALVEDGWDVMQEYEHLYPNRIRRYSAKSTFAGAKEAPRQYLREENEEEDAFFPPSEPAPIRETPVVTEQQTVASPTAGKRRSDKKSVDKEKSGGYIDVQAILDRVTPDEKKILLQLQRPLCLDELAAVCGMDTSAVLASLTMLEIKQYIRRLPGSRYELARDQS